MANEWNYLVSESLFATELVTSGLRRLCAVPVSVDSWPVSHDQTYPLHVGLHSYTSGLERLCKLTIACHGFATTGEFPRLKRYGHRIGELLSAVGDLALDRITNLNKTPDPAHRPGTELLSLLERFANGAGRYEHLDALWKGNYDVSTVDTWTHLCAEITTSERVEQLIWMHSTVIQAMGTLCEEGDLGAAGSAILDPLDTYLSPQSACLALELFETASWVASTLDAVTYYTNTWLPLLGEAVLDLQGPSEDFFKYTVAQIQDEDLTLEELRGHLDRFPEDDDEE